MEQKNVLLIGSGGREHALAWKLKQSELLKQLFIAPGNPGTAELGINLQVSINDFESIKKAVLENSIDLVVVGPEEPLVLGIHDFFLSDNELKGKLVIGPQKEGAALEGSKDFAKKFMFRHGIPTARFNSFTAETLQEGIDFLKQLSPPYVLKADGLAAGKGVVILDQLADAERELSEMLLDEKFGLASKSVVVEEFLKGIELSVFVLTDGINYLTLPEAKDYKRIGVNDTGLNTGGMGSISPVPFADAIFKSKVEQQIIRPTIEGLQKDGIPYVGFIFIGLMNVDGNPMVIEYNVRLGDPETESIMPRIESDLLEILWATAQGTLNEVDISISSKTAATIMMVSGGYPEAYEKDKAISGLDASFDSYIFHAGTKAVDKHIVTSGGRVLAITSLGNSIQDAISKSVASVGKVNFQGAYYRSDIGFDLINY